MKLLCDPGTKNEELGTESCGMLLTDLTDLGRIKAKLCLVFGG